MLKVNEAITIPWEELAISYARSAGPGGQNVNKRETKVVMHWNARLSPSLPEGVRARLLETYASRLTEEGEIVISSDEMRSRDANTKACLDKLQRLILSVARPPKIRKATKPTRGSQVRRLHEKKTQSDRKKTRQKVNFNPE